MTLAPYFAVAALLATLGAFAAGNIHGHGAERKVWQLAVAREQRDAAALLAKSEAAARAREQTIAVLKDQIEKEHIDGQARLTAAHTSNAVLLAKLGGLRDPRATCVADGMPADPKPAAGDPGGASGRCQLSGATSQALLDLAALADRTVAYAAACHAWAMGLAAAPLAKTP